MMTFFLTRAFGEMMADVIEFEIAGAVATITSTTFQRDGLYLETPETVQVKRTIEQGRKTWKRAIANGFVRDVAYEQEVLDCANGMCDHYTCTEGRSVDGWVEAWSTRWDYVSEAYAETVADADRWFASEEGN